MPPEAHGLLLLDKPPGISSTQALAKAKRLLGSRKAGHTGTLDPFATGLLPLVFGEATKFSRFLIDERKSYDATLRLGEETPTGDTEAPVARTTPVDVNSSQIAAVLSRFGGVQHQIPPMHSAVRIDGRRLYELARQGAEIDRPARLIDIYEIKAVGREADDLRIRVTCSKGTYIRTLAQDIGAALGCGAHLVALRRTAVGVLDVNAAITLEGLAAEGVERARERLLPLETLVAALPRLEASPPEADAFVHGRIVARMMERTGDVAVFGAGGRFLGVGWATAGTGVAPLRLLATVDMQIP